MSTSDPTAVLDTDYAPGATGGPRWGVVTISGASRRKQKRYRRTSQPWFEWNLAYIIRTAADAAALRRFRDAHEGGLFPFRFEWYEEPSASDEQFGEDAGTTHQLRLNRDQGTRTYDLDITRPVEPTTVKKGTTLGTAVTLTETVDFDVDYATGIVTLNVALTSGEKLWWSGGIHFLVHFVGDPAIEVGDGDLRALEDIIIESTE